MPTYEPYQQYDLPPLPRFKLLVTVVRIADGMYVVMSPICAQLGVADLDSQIEKLEGDHKFDGALRKVPYDTKKRGTHLSWGIRRHKFGEWIVDINPRKVRAEYRDSLEDLAAEATQFLDRAVFGKVANHMDPAPLSKRQQAEARAREQAGEQQEQQVHVIRPTLTGIVHFNCQNCGAPHRIDLGELNTHVELGEWSDDQPDE